MKMTIKNTWEPSFGLDDYDSDVRPRVQVVSRCGVGDVSFRIAKLVGPTGLVVGVDESAEVIDVAERRATVAGQCYWTRFAAADLSTFIPHERFDVVAVRLTLLLQHEGDDAVFLVAIRLRPCVCSDGLIMIVAHNPAGSN
jgi:SAM-dependent methyltransferase